MYKRQANKDIKEQLAALERVLAAANPFSMYTADELVPVKITVGDSQCVYHVRPELVRTVIGLLKEKKTRPFLFDTNVIYKGERTNAVDHMMLAVSKGFGPTKVHAPFIVADGLLGQDGKEYRLEGGHISTVRVPSFVGMLESLVVLSHVTGHIASGYAGALKNVAMGMACRPTKQVQHSSLKPHVISAKCTACGACLRICPAAAISWKDSRAAIEPSKCVGCAECLCACKFYAIFLNWHEDTDIFCQRMVEVAEFILAKFKRKFYINFALDITKECDCISTKDEEIIAHDIGILASDDPVALDKATYDLANKDGDVFVKAQGRGEYHGMLEYAAKRNVGSLEYELVNV